MNIWNYLKKTNVYLITCKNADGFYRLNLCIGEAKKKKKKKKKWIAQIDKCREISDDKNQRHNALCLAFHYEGTGSIVDDGISSEAIIALRIWRLGPFFTWCIGVSLHIIHFYEIINFFPAICSFVLWS